MREVARTASPRLPGFTLIELLTVVAIISLLISILMPSLSRARDQAKGVHCLARMKDMATAIGAYENVNSDLLPSAQWYPAAEEHEDLVYGWTELLFTYIYKEPVLTEQEANPPSFPVQRNTERERWAEYFLCKASPYRGVNSGHYRVYLPSWAAGTYGLNSDGSFDESALPNPTVSITRAAIRPKMILLGDANERSERGDGDPSGCKDDCSYIDAGEANVSGGNGLTGNRFSDRHYGGTNYLFQDFHGEWNTKLRETLAEDYDLNGVKDVEVVE